MLDVRGSCDPLLTIHVTMRQVTIYGIESLQYVQSIAITNSYSMTVHVTPYDQYHCLLKFIDTKAKWKRSVAAHLVLFTRWVTLWLTQYS